MISLSLSISLGAQRAGVRTITVDASILSTASGWTEIATPASDGWPAGLVPTEVYTTTGWQDMVENTAYSVSVISLAAGPVLVRWTGTALEVDLDGAFDDLPDEQEATIAVRLRFGEAPAPNLLINPTLTGQSPWTVFEGTLGANVFFEGGSARLVGRPRRIGQSIAFENGVTYRAEMKITRIAGPNTASAAAIFYHGNPWVLSPPINFTGSTTISWTFTANRTVTDPVSFGTANSTVNDGKEFIIDDLVVWPEAE